MKRTCAGEIQEIGTITWARFVDPTETGELGILAIVLLAPLSRQDLATPGI